MKKEEYEIICTVCKKVVNTASDIQEAEIMSNYHDDYVHDEKFVTYYKKK